MTLPPRFDRLADDLRELLAVVVGLVVAVAVGRFDAAGRRRCVDRRRVGQHGPAVAAEVAAEEDGRAAAGERHPDEGRAEQVPGVAMKLISTPGVDRHRPVEADRLEARERAEGVGLGEERLGRRVPRVAVLVGLARVFFLQPAGVGQHELAEVGGAGRAEDRPLEALRHEARQVARCGRGARASARRRRCSAGSTGSGSQLRRRSSWRPWKSPQSTSTRWPPASTRYFDPVTVRAAPRKREVRHGRTSLHGARASSVSRAAPMRPAHAGNSFGRRRRFEVLIRCQLAGRERSRLLTLREAA